MAEPVGSGISTSLTDVIKLREGVYSKEGKSIDDLFAISSNTVWAKLRSSVGKLIDTDWDTLQTNIDEVKGIKIDNTIAENFVLNAGTTSRGEQKPRSGVSFDSSTYDQDKAYNTFDNIGPRPMPGITGFSVKSKNAYGTILEASINFTVYSVQELNDMELVFFRPGYSALFEWGHSVYMGADGSLKKFDKDAQTVPDEKFFSRQSFEKIDKQIQKRREEGEGNYEGMFGYITNFNWSFRDDGGYDCTVKILSRNVILEDLKFPKVVNYIPGDEIKKGEKEEGKIERKSIFHYIFNRISKDTDDEFNCIKTLKKEKAKTAAATLQKTIKHMVKTYDSDFPSNDFKVFGMKADIKGNGWLGFFDETIRLQYIRLADFCAIYNAFCTLKDPVNDQNPGEPMIDTAYGNLYSTFPDHVTCDPLTCVLPKIPTGELAEMIIDRSDVSKNMKSAVGDKADDIMNIMVSTRFIQAMVDKISTGPEGTAKKGMIDVINDILDGVNGALSEIPDLDLHFDHQRSCYVIVDRNIFSAENPPPEINVTGLKSTITELGIESTISRNVSSQIAIAAQGNSGNQQENIAAIMEWNRGAIDRHMEIRRADDNKTDKDKEEKLEKLLEDMNDVWHHFNGTGWFTDQYIDPEFIEQLRGDWSTLMNTRYKLYNIKAGNPPRGVVPVELSLKMLGIGGFKIGTSFRINRGVLPSKYDDFSYIITGMEHTTANGLWWTNLKTQFYAGRKPSTDASSAAGDKYKNTNRSGGQPGSTSLAYPGDDKVPESPPCGDPDQKVLIPPSDITKQIQSKVGGDFRGRKRKNAAKVAHRKLYSGASYINPTKSIGVSGMCARWSYCFADYYINEIKGKGLTDRGTHTNAGGNANQTPFHNRLEQLGYTKFEPCKSVSKSEVQNWLTGFNWGFGDIAIYWANDGDGSHRAYGHAMYYMGEAHPQGGVWSSSVNYNYNKNKSSGFIYSSRNSNCWNLLVYAAPQP